MSQLQPEQQALTQTSQECSEEQSLCQLATILEPTNKLNKKTYKKSKKKVRKNKK